MINVIFYLPWIGKLNSEAMWVLSFLWSNVSDKKCNLFNWYDYSYVRCVKLYFFKELSQFSIESFIIFFSIHFLVCRIFNIDTYFFIYGIGNFTLLLFLFLSICPASVVFQRINVFCFVFSFLITVTFSFSCFSSSFLLLISNYVVFKLLSFFLFFMVEDFYIFIF